MNKNSILTLIALAALAVHAHAEVVAHPILVTGRSGDITSGNFLELLHSDNHRLVARPTRTDGQHRYDIVVTLANPALAFGNYSRMSVRIEAQTSNPVPLCRVFAERNGTTSLLGAMPLTTNDVLRSITVSGNVRAFIQVGGVVRLHLNGFLATPFTHRFDKISVIFS